MGKFSKKSRSSFTQKIFESLVAKVLITLITEIFLQFCKPTIEMQKFEIVHKTKMQTDSLLQCNSNVLYMELCLFFNLRFSFETLRP